MSNYNTFISSNHACFLADPFSKREAWSWLREQVNASNQLRGLSISFKCLAHMWRWHKSKVERFINTLKNEFLIETEIIGGRTVIKLATEIATKQKDRGDFAITCDTVEAQEEQATQYNNESASEAISRRNRDNLELTSTDFQKKEKYQKKESFDFSLLKEKTSPYGGVKKENLNQIILTNTSVAQVLLSDVERFAMSIGIEASSVPWELAKFKDYWLATSKKLPIDGVAAFRNWLRKSIEFKEQRKNYGTFNKNNNGQSKFSRFLAGGIRALAELNKSGLDWQDDRGLPMLLEKDSRAQCGLEDSHAVN